MATAAENYFTIHLLYYLNTAASETYIQITIPYTLYTIYKRKTYLKKQSFFMPIWWYVLLAMVRKTPHLFNSQAPYIQSLRRHLTTGKIETECKNM